jgi:glycine cleavage system regulatory protein
MSLVSGHLVTAFLLSGSSIDAAAVQLRLPHLRIDCMPISSDSVDWPLPGSSCWHANARLRGDTHLLLELTRVISERQLPIVALSSWLESDAEQRADPATHGTTGAEDRVEVVDLNFAVAPEPGGDDHHIVDELEAEIRQILPDAQLDIKLVTWPTRYRAQKNIVPTHASDVVVTVVGHARPGFVRSVLLGLTRAATRVDDAIVELCGSSMAILDGVSVFTMVFKRVRNVELQNLDRQIRNALSLQLRQRHQHMPIGVQVVEATAGWQDETEQRETTSSNRPDWPTHELTIRVADQPRVIAKVARLLASLKVNITWFVSHVLEPVIGERAATYAIKMHLSVPSESLDEVSASLRSLKEAEGWKEVSMREWSLAQ